MLSTGRRAPRRHEPAPQPKALPQRADGETGDGEAEVGDGVQGLPRLRRRLHEYAACEHRRVYRWCAVWTPGGSFDKVQ